MLYTIYTFLLTKSVLRHYTYRRGLSRRCSFKLLWAMRRPRSVGRVTGTDSRAFSFYIVNYNELFGSGSLPRIYYVMELLFNTRDELIRVNLKYVVYFEADDNYTHIYFSNGVKASLLCTLSNMEQLIDEKMKKQVQPFIRIGKRYIVNSSCIFQINTLRKKLFLTSFNSPQLYTLSVSKEALKKLKDLYVSNNS